MRVTVVAVGRLKERHWRDAAEEYAKRLRPYATLEVLEVPDVSLERGEAHAMDAEAEAVLRVLPQGARAVALDPGGEELSSEGLAAWLDALMLGGTSHLAFVVGGTAGLSPGLMACCAERLALSRMTLPHQLARVVLLEQLYRAFKIVRGEPYHR